MLLQERKNELYSRLCQDLKQFKPGRKFYSIRHIISRYNVSRRVVDATLTQMSEAGLVETIPSKGIYIKQTEASRSVAFFFPDWPTKLVEEQSKKLEYHLHLFSNKYDFTEVRYNYQADLTNLVENCDAEVSILAFPAREITRKELSFFTMYPKPVIFFDFELKNTPLNYISNSFSTELLIALNHLKENGHKSVVFLAAEPLVGSRVSQLQHFMTMHDFLGMKGKVINCHSVSGDYTPEKAYETLREYLRNHVLDFTAMFIPGAEAVKGVFRAFRETGIKIPDDVSIIGSGPPKDSQYFPIPITTIFNDVDEKTQKLAQEIHKLFELEFKLKHPINLYFTPKIFENESVKNIK